MNKEIIIQNHFCTLIANGVYGKKFKRELLDHAPHFAVLKEAAVFEDFINDEMINVWGMEAKDVKVLKEQHQLSQIQHFSTPHIRKALSSQKDGVYFYKHGELLSIVVIRNAKVKMHNVVDYNMREDVVYFILLYREYLSASDDVILSGDFTQDESSFLKKYFASVSELNLNTYQSLDIGSTTSKVLVQ